METSALPCLVVRGSMSLATLKPNSAASPAHRKLPSYFAALRTTCGWFGVGMPEMQRMLLLMRKQDTKPECFPKKLNRVMLNEADDGTGPWLDVLPLIAKRAVHARIHFDQEVPLFGKAGKFMDELVFELLQLYEQLLPKLKPSGVAPKDTMWVLVEEVFVPTAYLKLAQHWRKASGDELQGESCWYLPIKRKGERCNPVPRVLTLWLRAIGCRYGHDLGKLTDDATRKRVERWLRGDCVPNVRETLALVDKFANESKWTDTAAEWKTRFILACAMERLCRSMDPYFLAHRRDASLEIGKMIAKIEAEHIPMDDARVLADTWTFFAARLFQRRLRKEGRWGKEVESKVQPTATWSSAPGMSNEEVERNLEAFRWRQNKGNWFLGAIKRELQGADTIGSSLAIGRGGMLRERLLNLGAAELNRLLEEKGRRA